MTIANVTKFSKCIVALGNAREAAVSSLALFHGVMASLNAWRLACRA
jgi:hypothetical protein